MSSSEGAARAESRAAGRSNNSRYHGSAARRIGRSEKRNMEVVTAAAVETEAEVAAEAGTQTSSP